MGVLIPLFQRNDNDNDLALNPEQRIRMKLLHNSLEALKKEEESVETIIHQKCKDEIERLNSIEIKKRQFEAEIEGLKKIGRKTSESM